MPTVEGVVPTWLIAVVVVGIALAGWWFLRSRAVKIAPPEPPEIIARRELAEAAQLIESEPGVLCLRAVAAAMRRYLEGRFGIRAPTLTTREFLMLAAGHEALESHRSELGRFLAVCDGAMFAGRSSTRTERQGMHRQAVAFVETTSTGGAR